VLGCTHYSFLKPAIQTLIPDHIKIVDTGDAVASYLKHVLIEKDLLNQNSALGTTHFWTNSLKVVELSERNGQGEINSGNFREQNKNEKNNIVSNICDSIHGSIFLLWKRAECA
jgi:glutamate racemase